MAKLLRRYLRVAAKGQLRYPSVLALSLFGQVALPLSLLAGIAALFARFKGLAGWSAPEVMLCYGVAHCSFALAELAARGFDGFASILSSGEFDRILVRPRSTVLQVLGSRLDLSRIGRLGVGIAVLAWAAAALDAAWTPLKALALALMVLGGAAIFAGLFVLGAALAFLTTDGLEAVNILTDGGRELTQYPLSIYDRRVRRFFTYAVPFACVNYLPLLFIVGRPGYGPACAFLPLAGFAFAPLCLLAWRAGVRRYTSTGS